MLTVLFPLLMIGGIGFYYWNLRRKGGGSIAAGAQKQMEEKWDSLLGAGEKLMHHATAATARPEWQVMLRNQFPIAKLIFPVRAYQAALTSSGRILLGACNAIGQLTTRSALDPRLIRVLRSDIAAKGALHKLHEKASGMPFELATAVVELPGEKLPICFSGSAAFVRALQPQATMALSA
jgi:hypothetical protein